MAARKTIPRTAVEARLEELRSKITAASEREQTMKTAIEAGERDLEQTRRLVTGLRLAANELEELLKGDE